jgi:5-methylcytosine-specific restriction protein B
MNSVPPALNASQASSPCWFVGAMLDGRDQTNRFIDEGIWEHGFDDDRIATQVRSKRMGKRFEKILEEE